MHPGAVCLATIPPAQNPSPLHRRKHPFACLLPQKPFDREFSPPRRAQLLPMILSLPLTLSQTLQYPLLFLPYPLLSSGRFPITLSILPVCRTPLAYSPASTGRSPTPLFFALYPPHSSRPPNIIPSAWHLSLPFEPLPARPLSIHPPDSLL